jgi:hypothetical protein
MRFEAVIGLRADIQQVDIRLSAGDLEKLVLTWGAVGSNPRRTDYESVPPAEMRFDDVL